jgi:hypothetical protein
MAYVSKELKAKLAPTIKAICNKYKIKASLAVRNHSTLVLSVKQGDIDFIGNYNTTAYHKQARQITDGNMVINSYWYSEQFDGVALKFLEEVILAMNDGNHDHSDMQSDYFNVGWYVDVSIGRWDTPYALVK